MEHWQRFTAEEAARKLNTDISLGRTADKKTLGARRTSVFLLPRADARECFSFAMTDAAVLMFFLVAVISMLVGALAEAILSLALLFLACLVTGGVKLASRKRALRMATRMLPTVNLLSEGNPRREDCRELAVGDVIFLFAGDVVPADCLLIRSSRLRVVEYYTDVATGKRRAHAVAKNWQATYGAEDERESYDNMLYAGSAVASGKCKALVVATGADTRVAMLEGGIPLAAGDSVPRSVERLSRRGRVFATAMLISVLPITLVGTLCQPDGGLGIVGVFYLAVTLALTSFSEVSASAAEYISLRSLSELDRGAAVSVAAHADELAEADTLLLLCEASVLDTQRHVKRVFWNCEEKRGSLTSGAMKPLAERMDKLVAAAEMICPDMPLADADAFFDYVKSMGISRRWNISEGEKAMPRLDFPTAGAFSAVVTDEKDALAGKEIISCAQNAAIIRNCRRYRTALGEAEPLDQPLALRAVGIFNEYVKSGLAPYVIVSTVSVAQGMVLEGIVAVGVTAPEHNKRSADELREMGVRPILILPEESDVSVWLARASGIADSARDDGGIAIASELADGATLSALAHTCSVFVGFGKDGTAQISRALAQKGARAVSVVCDPLDMRGVVSFNRSIALYGASPDSVLISASSTVKAADRSDKHTGFGTFSVIARAARGAIRRLRAYGEYITACAAFRLAFTLLPLVAGVPSAIPSVPMLVLTGLFGDVAALGVIACAAERRRADAVTADGEGGERLSRWLGIACGAFLGLAAACVGMLLAANGILSAESYPSYALPSICSAQLAVLAVMLLRSRADVFCAPFAIFALASVALCAIPYTLAYITPPSAVASVILPIFGTASAHKLVMLCVPAVILLTTAAMLFADKLSSGALKAGFLKK